MTYENLTNSQLVATLAQVSNTMLDVEAGKRKLPAAAISKLSANAGKMIDEIEARGIVQSFLEAMPETTLRKLMRMERGQLR